MSFIKSSLVLSLQTANALVQKSQFKQHHSVVQRELCIMKNKWWCNISSKIQTASDTNNSKDFYALIRQAFGPRSSSLCPLKSLDGNTLIKDSVGIINRWKEHFGKLCFNQSVVDEKVIKNRPQLESQDLDTLPSLEEV